MGNSKTYSRLGGKKAHFVMSLINSLFPDDVVIVKNNDTIELFSDTLNLEIIQIEDNKIQIKLDASLLPFVASAEELNIGEIDDKFPSPLSLFQSKYERFFINDTPPEDTTMIWGKYVEL